MLVVAGPGPHLVQPGAVAFDVAAQRLLDRRVGKDTLDLAGWSVDDADIDLGAGTITFTDGSVVTIDSIETIVFEDEIIKT